MNPASPPETDTRATGLDWICLKELQLQAIIGVYPHERLHRQRLILDLAMQLDTRRSATSLHLKQTIDYAKIARDLRLLVQSAQFHLLETAAEAIAAFILTPSSEYACPESVRVTISKPSALDNAATPSVSIFRIRRDRTEEMRDSDDAAVIFESADVRIALVHSTKSPNQKIVDIKGDRSIEGNEILVPLADPGQIGTRYLHIHRTDASHFLSEPTQLYDFREAIGKQSNLTKNELVEKTP